MLLLLLCLLIRLWQVPVWSEATESITLITEEASFGAVAGRCARPAGAAAGPGLSELGGGLVHDLLLLMLLLLLLLLLSVLGSLCLHGWQRRGWGLRAPARIPSL